ncbi:hypothetical protein J2T10_003235 [Paenarthrobacter nicotinovorans]|uniref:Uncharacterized protein n=1 Tax=Paenarthrobacter nicotinovorans TaxID=29320 RepID=A0ABT9TPI3_PAENI|nr:hypothetical protein [Paenarthrobacter nicotinovorans]MDQ0103570.1 hypothetical protein [Paenarthrobacter nicotinovorans]GAT89765.1 hypothetical protein CVCC1112_4424 [Paenarthrobacter nicotinovorans]
MEDPTTLAINLTYLGTLGLALLMFLGLGLIVIITLVVAGVGRLVSVILLALIGVFPKKDTTPIVHLPARPGYVPDPVVGADAVDGAAEESAPVAAAVAAPSSAAAPAAPKRDLLGVTRRRISGASAAVKDGAWKSKVDPRKLPKPAEVKSAVEHQTAHHPIVVAAAKEPPVLSKDWADAVAEADRREAERAKAQQPPPIKVTVRDLDEPTPSSKSPAPANPPKKQGPVTSPKGKSQGPTKKGSLSGAARNS